VGTKGVCEPVETRPVCPAGLCAGQTRWDGFGTAVELRKAHRSEPWDEVPRAVPIGPNRAGRRRQRNSARGTGHRQRCRHDTQGTHSALTSCGDKPDAPQVMTMSRWMNISAGGGGVGWGRSRLSSSANAVSSSNEAPSSTARRNVRYVSIHGVTGEFARLPVLSAPDGHRAAASSACATSEASSRVSTVAVVIVASSVSTTGAPLCRPPARSPATE
jgi:hypothetical protein